MSGRLVTAIAAAILVVGGCGPRIERPTRICPGAESVFESLSSLRAQSKNVVPLKANGQCRLEYDGTKHKENFPIKLWFSPAFDVRLQGDVAFDPRGIVLGSNAREFWLAIKPKEVSSYWWGRWAEQDSFDKLPLNPKILLEALGIVKVEGGANWSLSNEGAFDVLTERNDEGAIIKRIYVHSCNYLVWRIEYFDVSGEVAAAAELYKYKEISRSFSVPAVIKIITRAEGKIEDSVSITLGSIKSTNFTEKQKNRLFTRPEPRGFKRVEKL